MSKKLFSEEEIEILSKNKYVKSISNRGITYTDEFKVLFMSQYNIGKLPTNIFEECSFVVLCQYLGHKKSNIFIELYF